MSLLEVYIRVQTPTSLLIYLLSVSYMMYAFVR